MPQRVQDVMTADPVTVEPAATVADAARLMKEHDVGAIIVADGKIRGMLTDRDIVVRVIAGGRDGESTRVADICSGDLQSVSPDEPLEQAIEEMCRHSIRRLPVVKGDRAVGILSLGDLAIERDDQSALAHISAAPPNR